MADWKASCVLITSISLDHPSDTHGHAKREPVEPTPVLIYALSGLVLSDLALSDLAFSDLVGVSADVVESATLIRRVGVCNCLFLNVEVGNWFCVCTVA